MDLERVLDECSELLRVSPHRAVRKVVSAMNELLEPRGCRLVFRGAVEGISVQVYDSRKGKWVERFAFGGSYDMLFYFLGVLSFFVLFFTDSLPPEEDENVISPSGGEGDAIS